MIFMMYRLVSLISLFLSHVMFWLESTNIHLYCYKIGNFGNELDRKRISQVTKPQANDLRDLKKIELAGCSFTKTSANSYLPLQKQKLSTQTVRLHNFMKLTLYCFLNLIRLEKARRKGVVFVCSNPVLYVEMSSSSFSGKWRLIRVPKPRKCNDPGDDWHPAWGFPPQAARSLN